MPIPGKLADTGGPRPLLLWVYAFATRWAVLKWAMGLPGKLWPKCAGYVITCMLIAQVPTPLPSYALPTVSFYALPTVSRYAPASPLPVPRYPCADRSTLSQITILGVLGLKEGSAMVPLTVPLPVCPVSPTRTSIPKYPQDPMVLPDPVRCCSVCVLALAYGAVLTLAYGASTPLRVGCHELPAPVLTRGYNATIAVRTFGCGAANCSTNPPTSTNAGVQCEQLQY
eukprot:3941109-Rhodomonas_salina.3